jgi:integrase
MRGAGGHITERLAADGKRRYLVKVELDRDPSTGRRRQRSIGTYRTKREAQEALAAAIATGPAQAAAKGTLAEYLEQEWLPSKADLSAASRNQYEWAAGYMTELMGAVKLASVTPRHVQEFNAALRQKELSSRSRQIMGKALRNALAIAVKRGYIPRNPADGVPIASGERGTELNFWTADEARKFLASPAVQEDRLQPCWRFLLATGLRRGEVCALRWQDVDLPGKKLTVRQAVKIDGYKAEIGTPKTRAAIRTVGLDSATVQMLKDWRDSQLDEMALLGVKATLVFTEADGSMIHPQTLNGRFASVASKSDARAIGLHGLRHTHATLALEAGVPLKVVSERLGHASIQVTADTYQHALEHLQHDAAEAIAVLLLEATEQPPSR